MGIRFVLVATVSVAIAGPSNALAVGVSKRFAAMEAAIKRQDTALMGRLLEEELPDLVEQGAVSDQCADYFESGLRLDGNSVGEIRITLTRLTLHSAYLLLSVVPDTDDPITRKRLLRESKRLVVQAGLDKRELEQLLPWGPRSQLLRSYVYAFSAVEDLAKLSKSIQAMTNILRSSHEQIMANCKLADR